MKITVSILLVFISFITLGQTNDELKMMYEINKIRKDPKSYIPVVESYIVRLEKGKESLNKLLKNSGTVTTTTTTIKLDNKNNNHEVIGSKTTNGTNFYDKRISDAKELISVLSKTEPMDTLVFDTIVYPITVDQANYLKEIGKLGHGGRNGTTLLDRTKPYVCSENAAHNTYDMLLVLMVDSGVPSRGHRKNILNKDATSVSISINDFCMVQNFVHPHTVVYK